MSTYYPIIAGLIIAAVSLSGAIFLVGPLKRLMNSHLSFLSSFSAGVYIVTALLIVNEAIHILGVSKAILFVTLGIAVFFVAEKMVPESHHCTHDDCVDGHNEKFANKVLASDALHNIGDGILVAAAFAADYRVGILAAASVLVHEFVQEISEYTLLREAGYSARKALFRNLLVSLSIFLGIGIGFLIGEMHELEAAILAVAAGAFLQIVFVDILPHKTHGNIKHILTHALYFLVGASIIYYISTLVPHTHGDHVDEHGHEEESHLDHEEETWLDEHGEEHFEGDGHVHH